ncbi:MAG: hypothetical protein M1331_02870 [Candidatus Marsarchaeota archaeon]|nr:hypothetical protein [Candidatus Marsarchaeota archaeon]MCL5106309.1 hypothetical protein [Candidatus Marsarchaeota archaeon]
MEDKSNDGEEGFAIKRSREVYRRMKNSRLLSYYYSKNIAKNMGKMEISGSSPTDIFIGSFGYPKVYIGPMLPSEFGDTSLLGAPELWAGKSISQIIDMRSRLVRGMHVSSIFDVEKGKIQEQIQDLALAEKPANADMALLKKPFVKMSFNDVTQPFGPSAQIESIELQNMRANRDMEYLHNDTDATAASSILELYSKHIHVSKLQQGLSAGLFGLKNSRKFVPTRWSITGIDDIISKSLRERIKDYGHIDAIHAYHGVALDNHWLVFLVPGAWEYESIEAWFPDTSWNRKSEILMCSSYEGYKGRSAYAEIGGAYYAARLAVAEKLKQIQRQASVIILREIHENYSIPVGVWQVREHLRRILSGHAQILSNAPEINRLISQKFAISPAAWTKNSRMLAEIASQRRLSSYFK